MEALLEAAFWLSLAMLGLVGVVYALGYPYLSGVRDLMDSEKRLRRAGAEAERREIEQQLRRPTGIDSKVLTEAARKLQSREIELARRVRRLDALPATLNVTRAVFRPAGAFLAAFVLASIAKSLLPQTGQPEPTTTVVLAVVSAAAIAWGLWKLATYLLNLNYLSQLLIPVVSPIETFTPSWRAGAPNKITLAAKLERGRALHSLQILLYLPPQVSSATDFNEKMRCPADHPTKPSYNCIPSREWPILKRDMAFTYDYDRLSCATRCTLRFFYRIVTEEYVSDDKEIVVTVT
jgi:hypothetical protein